MGFVHRFLLSCLLCLALCGVATGNAVAVPMSVLRVDVSGPISPAQDEMLTAAVAQCERIGCSMLLIVLDTPGGLGESMRNMVKTMLNAPVPVAVWVGPSGARAASAGVFLVAASTVAGMAPQTTMGAASPVGLGGGDIEKTMAAKVRADFLSLVRGVAGARDRNATWYAEAVDKASSVTAAEALELGAVEYVSGSATTFLQSVGVRGVDFKDQTIRFSPNDIVVHEYDPGVRYRLLSWLLHPQIAYMLLLAGMLGLFVELTHPGVILPGVLGTLGLLLGLYALSVLPTNAAGLLLILFGLVLFGLEIKIVSFGLLALGGAAALFVGSLILFRDEFGYVYIPLSTVIPVVLFFCSVAGGLVFLVIRSQRRERAAGLQAMIGLVGTVRKWKGNRGTISVRGEIWAAMDPQSDFPLSRDDEVEIVDVRGLTLEIRALPPKPLKL